MRRCLCLRFAVLVLAAVTSDRIAAQTTLSEEPAYQRDYPLVHEIGEAHRHHRLQRENSRSKAELLWVMDGDSLRARIAGESVEVRLADIDAPEHQQPYAWEAKLALIDMIRGKRLVIVPREVDRHGRLVARVWAGDLDVNRELVVQGAAWFYPAYAKDKVLTEHEQQARASKRGLWGVPGKRIAPWVWRKRQYDAAFPRNALPIDGEPDISED